MLTTALGHTEAFQSYDFEDCVPVAAQLAAPAADLTPQPPSDLLSEVVKKYLDESQRLTKLRPKTLSEKQDALDLLLEIIGDKPLGAVADLQLAPSSLDPGYNAFIRTFIGDRADFMMPAASLEAAGALVTLSSDFDADELSPLVKIQTAVERRTEGARDVDTAIRWMTINPAKLLQQDRTTGSLEVGKFADLVVIDRDITATPVDRIGRAEVVATLLQGKPVFDAEGLFAR